MTHTHRSTGGRLIELSADECWELLRTEPVGRLAWNGTTGPTVIPVNYVVTANGIEIRTAVYSAAVRETDDSLITFQADEIDAQTRTGWSVLAHGRASIDWSDERADTADIDVWPGGVKSLRLHLEVSEITGRRLSH